MPKTYATKSPIWLAVIALTALVAPSGVAGQSDLDAGDASEFMGVWAISMDSDFGPILLDLEIVDMDGKVGAAIGSPEMGGMQDVTDVTRDGAKLILRYEAEAQGQYFNVIVDLEAADEGLDVGFDAADGQFFASGTATKAS
jgi:hypothetical protein